MRKITVIPDDLLYTSTADLYSIAMKADRKLQVSQSASQSETNELIFSSPNKSCDLDLPPTWLLKMCIDPLLQPITAIINRAHRFSRNLEWIKKLCVAIDRYVIFAFCQKVYDIRIDDLYDRYQSAYRKCHSTERALTKVQDDIYDSLFEGSMTALVLLDLSAAFDVIDHV